MATPPPTDDGKLLRRWLDRGEEAAFRELVDRYTGLVYHSALRTCGNSSVAGEGAQLTFIVLARRARQLTSRSSLAGWLHQTAVLQTRNLIRKQRREERKLHSLTAMTPDSPPDGSRMWREMAPVLDDALAALPESDREAILLRFYRSLSFPEIAATIGIAGDAARKRVDRAVERLRAQLERRGCHLSTAACLGALGSFAAEAKAAGALSSTVLATNALAATTTATLATGLTSTTIAIIMTKKASIIAGAALLLAGAGAVALINSKDDSEPAQAAAENVRPASNRAERTGPGSTRADASRARPRDPAENPEFVSKYGEARTNLSKFVAGNVIDLLDDALSMGEMATTGLGGAFGQRGALQMALGRLGGQLNLDEEQRKQTEALVADFQQRELARTKSAVESLRNDPEALMRMMLASDAYSRGELSEEEYKAIQAGAQTDLEGIMNPLDRQNFQGGRPLADETFRQGMLAVLDPDQAATFEAAVENRNADGNTGSIADLPAMDLEQLDKTVTSAKAVTSGVRQMMEGLGGLQDLGPLLEQQQRRRQEGTD